MPILGSRGGASVRAFGRFATTAAPDIDVMFPLQVVTVGAAGASSVSFTNIPSTYNHLQMRGILRKTGAATSNYITFNNDSGSNYSLHFLAGNGSVASAYAEINTNYAYVYGTDDTQTANIYSPFVMDILDYKNTNKNKTVRMLNGLELNDYLGGYGQIYLHSFVWRNSTDAINSIKIVPALGSHKQYSHFALYGIKGA